MTWHFEMTWHFSSGLLEKYAQDITDLRLPPDDRQPSRLEHLQALVPAALTALP